MEGYDVLALKQQAEPPIAEATAHRGEPLQALAYLGRIGNKLAPIRFGLNLDRPLAVRPPHMSISRAPSR
jgi:hypothetical protein